MPACVDTCPTDYNHNMKQLMKIGKRLLQDIEGFGVSFALESSTGPMYRTGKLEASNDSVKEFEDRVKTEGDFDVSLGPGLTHMF